jgi:hypothetical protein
VSVVPYLVMVSGMADGGPERRRADTRRIRSIDGAIRLAIEGRFWWAADDFRDIYQHFRHLRSCNAALFTADGNEGWYSLACRSGNTRAAISFESWKLRRPFFWNGPRYGASRDDKSPGARLYVGAEFLWEGMRVRVNSFSENGSHINAAAYDHDAEVWSTCGGCGREYQLVAMPSKPLRLFSLQRSELEVALERIPALVGADVVPAPPQSRRRQHRGPDYLARFRALTATRRRGERIEP